MVLSGRSRYRSGRGAVYVVLFSALSRLCALATTTPAAAKDISGAG